ncbi:sensor histidine kinase [Undibacterium sp.]|jgi:signal transduction histidine kinase/ligand-binding sensor domain-containing protein|uniref:sensor histidine kinase n=1 Tax=Undibacterium sp. TaxID=1914977 RepID=UPI002C8863D1|nr:two-component regulator propeller domain-containing protein [Undibacterium sp.]HTD02546.1 two-component regulator propeller domain-containing protein [Undibacterium sp.]
MRIKGKREAIPFLWIAFEEGQKFMAGWIAALMAVLLQGTALSATGASPEASLHPMSVSNATPIDMHHTSWTAKDGAPSFIIAIAQMPDGWLWLASPSGIFRFDGVTFQRFRPNEVPLMSNNVWSMRLLASGSLWFGYRMGGASVWKDGKVRNFGLAEGMLPATVYDFAEDGSGKVWAATSQGLRVFDGKRWYEPAQHFHAPEGTCTLLQDEDGSVWAQCESGAFKLAPQGQTFVQMPGPAGLGRLVQGPNRTVWSVGGPKGEIAALNGIDAKRQLPTWPQPRTSGGTMLFDRDAEHLWITRADGLIRTSANGSNEFFGVSQGLSGAIPNTILQDREGNVWVGTENGLDRFRRNVLSGATLPQIYVDSPAIAAGENGSLWVGKTLLAKPTKEAFANIPQASEKDTVILLWREAPDSLWIVANDGLFHQRGSLREQIAMPKDVQPPLIRSIVRDGEGSLWISIRRAGMFRLRGGVWEAGGGFPELKRAASWMHCDRDGRMWFAFPDNKVMMLNKDKLYQYGIEDGLQVGLASQIIGSGDDIWVAGENGLFHFDGHQFVPILGVGEESMLGVSGILEFNGALWLNSAAGITTIDMGELKHAMRDVRYRVQFRRLDHKDGLQGVATQGYPVPTAVIGSDGVLWFSTTAGVFWLNPKTATKNSLPPPVYVRRVTAAGVEFPLVEGVMARLPPHPGRIQIDYTALSLTMPERMQFRFQLEGVDDGWQDAGTSRTATYTDLGPGEYRFKVKASNNDGVWNEEGAVMQFYLVPAFYQTLWFRILVAMLIASVFWAIYKLRLAQVARQIRARIEERLMERERIARELHDTLLQGTQAMILRVHAATARVPKHDPVREMIDNALEGADSLLQEGRERVHDLRAHDYFGVGVAASIRHSGTSLAEESGVKFEFEESEPRRSISSLVEHELYRIANEALTNAFRHSQATRIKTELIHERKALILIVQDNGLGLPPEVMRSGQLAGHWGLPGMRERAAKLGATLVLESAPGKGTMLRLSIPARMAYNSSPSPFSWIFERTT